MVICFHARHFSTDSPDDPRRLPLFYVDHEQGNLGGSHQLQLRTQSSPMRRRKLDHWFRHAHRYEHETNQPRSFSSSTISVFDRGYTLYRPIFMGVARNMP